MKIRIRGRTDATITFNKLGLIFKGQIESGLLNIDSMDKQREINELSSAGLIDVVEVVSDKKEASEPKSDLETPESKAAEEKSTETQDKQKRNRGRPKGSKNKSKTGTSKKSVNKTANKSVKKTANKSVKKTANKSVKKTVKKTVKDDETILTVDASTNRPNDPNDPTESEGSSNIVISTGETTVKTKMRRSATGDMPETERTKDSLEAMEKLEQEEKGEKTEDAAVDESTLDPSEQAGRKATILGEGGAEQIDMVNSIVPESDVVRNRSPFVEDFAPDDADKDGDDDAFIDGDDNEGDDVDFIEI